jgi:hypothetical protein
MHYREKKTDKGDSAHRTNLLSGDTMLANKTIDDQLSNGAVVVS